MLAIIGFLTSSTVWCQQRRAAEYQVKAAFLYNFAKFVEWPADAFARPDSPLQICVLGENPFGADLEAIINGKEVGGHPVRSVEANRPREMRTCHILFVSSSDLMRLKEALSAVTGHWTLVVSEGTGFTQHGSMLNFVLEEDRVRFEVNDKAATSAGLKISSKLLSVAKSIIE
jgi:hypothetical protein